MHTSMPGFPIHMRNSDSYKGELTRCSVFTSGARGRVTENPADVTCSDCLREGPGDAFVILPDGFLIERRCGALRDYSFGVAVSRTLAQTSTVWRLGCWAKNQHEAEFLCTTYSDPSATQILPVRLTSAR